MGTILIHLDTIHDIHYIWVYQKTVFISIFQRPWELYHFTLSLFSVHYIQVYRWNVSVGIFRDYKKCLLLNAMIINDLLTIHFFLIESLMEWKVVDNIWRAFWNFSWKFPFDFTNRITNENIKNINI